jgi:hypothetical protein
MVEAVSKSSSSTPSTLKQISAIAALQEIVKKHYLTKPFEPQHLLTIFNNLTSSIQI